MPDIKKRTFTLIAMVTLLVLPFSFALLKKENGEGLLSAFIITTRALGVYSVIIALCLSVIHWLEKRISKIAHTLLVLLWLSIFCIVAILRFLLQVFGVEISAYHIQMLKETNQGEATDFIQTYILSTAIFGVIRDFAVALLCAVLIFLAIKVFIRKTRSKFSKASSIGFATWIIACCTCFAFNLRSFGEKYLLEEKGKLSRYPIHQLLRAYYQGENLNKEIKICIGNLQNIKIDSCSYAAPNIVLIIGESHNRHHSSLYGYPLETNPLLKNREDLYIFKDVIAPSNATTVVFRHLMSCNDVSPKYGWCDAPLFPAVFKKAGYNVIFFSNQFCRGGWDADAAFLNYSSIDTLCFDIRNTERYQYDGELIEAYRKTQRQSEKSHNLIIFNLIGQHVNAKERFPKDIEKFTTQCYKDRHDLSLEQRQQIADYDNATLYNDMVVNDIIKMYENKNAIVIYTSDHGDEVNDFRPHVGRSCDYDIYGKPLIKSQLDIPFLIWCSPSYKATHPHEISRIAQSTEVPFMTDDISNLLFDIAGIYTPDFRPSRSPINKLYKPTLPRLFINLGTFNAYREYK